MKWWKYSKKMYGALKGQQFHSCDFDISFLFSLERKLKSTVRLYFGCNSNIVSFVSSFLKTLVALSLEMKHIQVSTSNMMSL